MQPKSSQLSISSASLSSSSQLSISSASLSISSISLSISSISLSVALAHRSHSQLLSLGRSHSQPLNLDRLWWFSVQPDLTPLISPTLSLGRLWSVCRFSWFSFGLPLLLVREERLRRLKHRMKVYHCEEQYSVLQTDIHLMKKIGLDSFRFSISWTRIFPEGRGKVNDLGVKFYNNVINELLANGGMQGEIASKER
ncbi:hypothetical protein QN277_024177 [Acacia crassicarpa]|uniref:Beta-glucosidase n=1 Tax=Acacia crassicarpa TaxID=499986 RepID=A0AAE1JE78_9FABA|nr:hypothetical protein QN277_024177 [Acacia crassicarpa]